jgi:hypothetical protein
MRDVLLSVLQDWKRALSAQDADHDLDGENESDYDLDSHLYGVALFLKGVAHKTGDVELLGISTKLERDLKARFAAADHADEEWHREGDARLHFEDAVKRICIQHFFKEPAFKVDMSKYRAMIDDQAPRVRDAGELEKLRRYIDDDLRLRRIYADVKNSFFYRSDEANPRLPTFEEVKAAFERVFADVLRRADAHVSAQLRKLTTGT